jgi:hypothetical protein
MRILASADGTCLSVEWNKDGAIYLAEVEDLLSQTSFSNGDALFTIHVTICDSSSIGSRAQAKLFSSIEMMKGNIPDVLREWKKIMGQFGESQRFQGCSSNRAKEAAVPIIHEQEQHRRA